MHSEEYTLFQTTDICQLNEYMSTIRPYLFFAANWAPKPSIGNNPALTFRIAVTNGYGLFKDCANYLQSWIDTLVQLGVLASDQRSSIKQLITRFVDFRSLFCHNQNAESSQTKRQAEKIKNFLYEEYNISVNPDIPLLIQVNAEVFQSLIAQFCIETRRTVENLTQSMKNVPNMEKDKQECVWESWCDCVASWYSRENNVINCVARDLERLYRHEFNAGTVYSWYKQKEVNEKRDLLRIIIKEMDEPAYPYSVIASFIRKYYLEQ